MVIGNVVLNGTFLPFILYLNLINNKIILTLMTEGTMKEADQRWLCPWCGEVACLPTRYAVICHSQTCQCGALALGVPLGTRMK